MSDGVRGKVLLISGSTGIAAATARLAVEQGASVFLASLAQAGSLELTGACESYVCDLTQTGAAEEAVDLCLKRFQKLDGLFNVAGGSGRRYGDGPVDECSEQGWDQTLAVNLKTVFLLSRAAIRFWLRAGTGGAILNMSSVSALSPEPRHFATHAYAASKAAILGLTRSMAAYYAPRKIRVNAIAPGLVRTPMSLRAQNDPAITGFILGKQPLSGGFLEAEDVARAALFLLSDASRHITGETLIVDGGWSVSGA